MYNLPGIYSLVLVTQRHFLHCLLYKLIQYVKDKCWILCCKAKRQRHIQNLSEEAWMQCVHVLSVAQHSPLLNPYALYVVELFIIFLQIGMCFSFHTTTLIIAGRLKQSGRLMVVLGPGCSRDSNPAYRNISWWVYSWVSPFEFFPVLLTYYIHRHTYHFTPYSPHSLPVSRTPWNLIHASGNALFSTACRSNRLLSVGDRLHSPLYRRAWQANRAQQIVPG